MGYTHPIGEDERRVADEIGKILCSTLPKPSEVEAANPQPLQ